MIQPEVHRAAGVGWLDRLLGRTAAHKTPLIVLTVVALSWGGLYIAFTRPLTRQIDLLQSHVSTLTQRMEAVAARRGSASEAADLLAVLASQEQTFTAAREALDELQALRAALEHEARLTAPAATGLVRIAELQRQVLQTGAQAAELRTAMSALAALQADVAAAGRTAGELESRIAELDALHARIAAVVQRSESEREQLSTAEEALARFGRLKSQVLDQSAQLTQAQAAVDAGAMLQASLLAAAETAPAAQSAADGLRQLVDKLAAPPAESLAQASNSAAELLAIHDLLVNGEALQFPVAEHNLRALLSTQTQLLRATPHIAAAAENLELLGDFQEELTRQLGQLSQMRADLSEIVLLRDTVLRVCGVVEPLAQLYSLRRLDANEVRIMAREILERRTAQAGPLPCERGPGDVSDIGPLEGEDRLAPEPRD